MRCPACNRLIRKSTKKCWHCNTWLDDSDEQIRYLELGFDRINKELDLFHADIQEVKGLFLKIHRFSITELKASKRLSMIESIMGQMKHDMGCWRKNEELSVRIQSAYSLHCQQMERRLDSLLELADSRETTKWERFIDTIKGLITLFKDYVLPYLNFKYLIPEKTGK